MTLGTERLSNITVWQASQTCCRGWQAREVRAVYGAGGGGGGVLESASAYLNAATYGVVVGAGRKGAMQARQLRMNCLRSAAGSAALTTQKCRVVAKR